MTNLVSLYKNNKEKKTTPFKLYYLGQWKLDGTALSNKAGITLTGNWQIPNSGSTGNVQNTITGVNGYLSVNAKTAAGSTVVEEALDANDVGQQWERSVDDGSGFFTLKNPNSGLFLTMKTANKLTIGNTQFFCVVVFLPCCFFTYRSHGI